MRSYTPNAAAEGAISGAPKRCTGVRQHAILFAAIVLLAAMLNVAVAWSCAFLAPRELDGADFGSANEGDVLATLLGRDYAHHIAFRYDGWGVSDDVLPCH